MKSNKKGFTLIELLAVIVILAIIALIATPIVLNIIGKARQSAARNSVYGMMNAVEYVYFESLFDSDIILPLTVTCTKADGCYYIDGKEDDGTTDKKVLVKSKGTQPTAGTFTLQGADAAEKEGQFADTTDIVINGYNCSIKNQNVTCGTSAPATGA